MITQRVGEPASARAEGSVRVSFFRKLKDRVTTPDADVTLRLSRSSFALGDTIEGTLTATSQEEFDCTEIRLEFECKERKRRMTWQFDAAAKREVAREVQASAVLYSAKPVLSGPLHLAAGLSQSFPLKVRIPVGERPTYHSVDNDVSWRLKGVIAVDGRPDVTSGDFEVRVVPVGALPIVEKEVIREVVMIRCTGCGALNPSTAVVCSGCGAKL